jgi:hypothetical protein
MTTVINIGLNKAGRTKGIYTQNPACQIFPVKLAAQNLPETVNISNTHIQYITIAAGWI